MLSYSELKTKFHECKEQMDFNKILKYMIDNKMKYYGVENITLEALEDMVDVCVENAIHHYIKSGESSYCMTGGFIVQIFVNKHINSTKTILFYYIESGMC